MAKRIPSVGINKPRYRHSIKPEDAKFWYFGSVHYSDMVGDARIAYSSWKNQRNRCYNKKRKDYKYYGLRGVRVLYSSREFVGWWLEQIEKKFIKDPTIDRIDHSKDYCFQNIRMITRSENSKERYDRLGLPKSGMKPILCLDYKTMTPLVVFESAAQAQACTAVHRASICKISKGKDIIVNGKNCGPYLKTGEGFTFRYYEDWKAAQS